MEERKQSFLEGTAVVFLVVMLLVFGFGLYQLLTYTIPMHKGDYATASRSYAADRPTVLYDAGLQFYQLHAYERAKILFVAAYSACTESSGSIPQSRQKLAGQIQFMLGNACEGLGQAQPAVEAYAQALRHDPENLYAKYNLERLLMPPPSSGGGQGGQGSGQSGNQGNQQQQPGNQGNQGNQQQQPGNQGNQGNPTPVQPGGGVGKTPKKGI